MAEFKINEFLNQAVLELENNTNYTDNNYLLRQEMFLSELRSISLSNLSKNSLVIKNAINDINGNQSYDKCHAKSDTHARTNGGGGFGKGYSKDRNC